MKKSKGLYLFIHILFYFILGTLICFMILPYTSVTFRKRFNLPLSLRLNKEDVVLKKGETDKLYVIGINKRVSYSSSDFKVAEVTINGKILTRRAGQTIIKARVDGRVLKCRVRVIELNKKKITLSVGQSQKLSVKGIKGWVRWKSMNKKIVKISRFGKVTGKKKGTAIVKAKVKGKTLSCKVTVK